MPAEVIKATKNGSMLMFTAYGDEATFIHPARPADSKVAWDQEWFARVSFKSVRMDMISPEGVMDLGAMSGGTAAKPDPKLSDEEYCAQLAEQQRKPSMADAIPGGRLLGRFGRKKQDTTAAQRPALRQPPEEVALLLGRLDAPQLSKAGDGAGTPGARRAASG